MKFKTKLFTALELFKLRNRIHYPIYQRTEDVWDQEKRRLLIDSMLRGIDIPKLYYFDNGDETYDCVDGHQRTQTVMLFLANDFSLKDGRHFKDLTDEERRKIEDYEFSVSTITQATDEDLRDLFLRLQLGVPTNSAEKLNAMKSNMGDFVKEMVQTPFIQKTNVTARRYGKLQLCAQICINSITRATERTFSNCKYEDLRDFYREYYDFDKNSEHARRIGTTLDHMDRIFGPEASYFTNRANTVSAYLFVEDLMQSGEINDNLLKQFFMAFVDALREEVRKGIHANNELLLYYHSRIIQGADTRASIEIRDRILKELYQYYEEKHVIKVQLVGL